MNSYRGHQAFAETNVLMEKPEDECAHHKKCKNNSSAQSEAMQSTVAHFIQLQNAACSSLPGGGGSRDTRSITTTLSAAGELSSSEAMQNSAAMTPQA